MAETRGPVTFEPAEGPTPHSAEVGRKRTRFSWKRVLLALLLVFAVVAFFGFLDSWYVHGSDFRKVRLGAECAARLRRVGGATLAYAEEGAQRFPPNLESGVSDSKLASSADLVSRFPDYRAPNCDFGYVTGLTLADPLRWIIVYVAPANCNGRVGCVFYVDGNLQCLPEPQFSQEIARFKAEYEQARGQPPVIIPPH